MRTSFVVVSTLFALGGCAMPSNVQDTGGGAYLIAAQASSTNGGAAAANEVAFKDANQFCAAKGDGYHAIVLSADDRNVYQSGVGSSAASSANGQFTDGNTHIHFKCGD